MAEDIGELRRELQQAMQAGEGELLRFELRPVELEATVAVEKGGGGGAKSDSGCSSWAGTPRPARSPPNAPSSPSSHALTASGEKALIAGDEAPRER